METTNKPQSNGSNVIHFDIIGRQPTQQEAHDSQASQLRKSQSVVRK